MFNKKYISLEELKKMDMNLGEIISVSFSRGGGPLGLLHLVLIIFNDNNLLMTLDRENNNSPTIDRKYSLSSEDAKKVKELIKEYNFPAWKSLPLDITSIKTDVPHNNFSLLYENGDYTFEYDKLLMTEEEKEVINSFMDYVSSLIKEENLIEENETMVEDIEE